MTAVAPNPPDALTQTAPTSEVTPRPARTLEPGLVSMLVAALVLLAAVGVVLWIAAATPNGRSVVVTIRAS